jgi:hypothetical protein
MKFAMMALTAFVLQLRSDSTTHRVPQRTPCIPTEPMPVAGKPPIAADSVRVRRILPMPVVRPDTTQRLPMFVVKATPCYQLDSIRPR